MKILPAFLFGVLYLLSTPVRHPAFSSPVFVVALLVGVVAVGWIMAGKKISIGSLFMAALLGHVASVIANLIAWLAEGNNGVIGFLQVFGAKQMAIHVFGMPIFSYVFLLFPIALALAAIPRRRNGHQSPA